MLVTFSCDAHENIVMFGDVALRLIKMMGHSGVIPSAILAEDVPSALTRLKQALEQEKQKTSMPNNDDGDDEPEIGLKQRAFPLIELLEAAVSDECDVMWR